jgi:hypothetical protein
LQQDHLAQPTPTNPITPATFTAVVVTFLVVARTAPTGSPRRLWSAVIGALAAPMIFELPFDLIVMSRTYPPIPPYPGLYRALFFLPLFLIEVTTLWLVTTSPRQRSGRGQGTKQRSASWSPGDERRGRRPLRRRSNSVSRWRVAGWR